MGIKRIIIICRKTGKDCCWCSDKCEHREKLSVDDSGKCEKVSENNDKR